MHDSDRERGVKKLNMLIILIDSLQKEFYSALQLILRNKDFVVTSAITNNYYIFCKNSSFPSYYCVTTNFIRLMNFHDVSVCCTPN